MQLAVWVGDDLLTSLDAAFDFKVFVDPLTANGNCLGLTVFNDVDLPILTLDFGIRSWFCATEALTVCPSIKSLLLRSASTS